MYGISNSQQQGGGGGGAASYKAIKSTLTASDWQEVAGATPFFVGENAMEWAVNAQMGLPAKSQSTNIGLVAGNSYTITVVADSATYTSTSEAYEEDGIVVLVFETSTAAVYVYDKFDAATMSHAAEGSFCAVETTANSLVITNFSGKGFGTTIQATIADSAIKVNSAVTMYTNTSEKITVGTKTNGNVTLIAPSVPATDIPYSLEIVGTDTEGLFELINGYVPEIPDTPSGAPQWHTIYEDTAGTGAVSVELSEPLQAGGLYRITLGGSVFMFCFPDAGDITQFSISREVFQDANTMGHKTYNFEHYKTSSSLECHYLAQYTITADGVSNILFADNTTIQAMKITKVEVYR